MIIKDTFSKFTNISKLYGCIAFFTNEKSEITHLKKYFSALDHKNLNLLLKIQDLKIPGTAKIPNAGDGY